VTAVVTDLGVLEPDPESCELTLTELFPGVWADDVRAATGWSLRVADGVRGVAPPTDAELNALRALQAASGENGGT
jgi:acyl CoA:acetate/3-ketoacid CoA transferase beta subunit